MSGRKKKLSQKLKRYNIILIILLSLLSICLLIVMISQMFTEKSYYKIESREENIEKSKKSDTTDHKTIGWIRVQGTNIDYPVYWVNTSSYEYPVTSSYTWSLNQDENYHNVMRIYGHNIMNLSSKPIHHDDSFDRMEELMNFLYFDFAKENKYIQLTMNGKDYLYQIFSVSFMKIFEMNSYPYGEFSQQARNNYVENVSKESIYDYDVEVSEDDNILSVVTCTRFFNGQTNYDFIVTGRLVRENEKIQNYTTRRNKNYEKIAETMKGVDEDETAETA